MSELPTISVTELVSAFKEVVETALPPACVQGEVSNCKQSAAGHYYLTLKDDRSEIGAVIWRGVADRLKFRPKDGLKVLATGGLQVYVARGSCQFIISDLKPDGIGELELAFRQLKDKLEAEGLFSAARKRPLPKFPRRVALITSPTSAAVKDMIQVMVRRWPSVDIILLPVPVQGVGVAPRIAKAINFVKHLSDVDVVITGRGGGSLEDLWAFNEEVVARAIVECPVPVISAVGHEIDVSISDLVADRRALTPSEAGELAVPSISEIRGGLQASGQRLRRALRGRLKQYQLRLQAIESRRIFRRPETLVDQQRQRCDDLVARAERAIRLMVERKKQKLASLAGALDALSPLKVLSRGYSLTSRDGRIVHSVGDLNDGEILETRFSDGTVKSRVEGAQ
ncbi:MAG: exodeoxyribonuclease VII large subunit [Fuerstiella sp.]